MRFSALVGAILAICAVCAVVVMTLLHRSPSTARVGASGSSGHVTYTYPPEPTVRLALPPGFADNAELLREYQLLASDLGQLKGLLHRMQSRVRDQAYPPDVVGLPSAGGGARNRDGAGALGASTIVQRDNVDTDTIFVSVASFRDDECFKTVNDMFVKAKNPKRVFLGIIQQNEPTDTKQLECVPLDYGATCSVSDFCPTDNIRVRRVVATEAKGPTFGRYVAMLMYRGEKYFMMIDSHNRFVREWDTRLINMYRLIPSKKGVLSHYPSSWTGEGMNLEGGGGVTVMCNGHFIGTGFIRMDGTVMERTSTPRLQPFSAAGFLFADARLVHEVPFDPYLDYLFDGEEILYSARMWTHGWDLYAPNENMLFHFYIRSHAPRVWSVPNNQWWVHQQVSNARVQMFLKVNVENSTDLLMTPENVRSSTKWQQHEKDRLLAEMDRYGLGTERSIEQYWKFAMVDPIKRQAGQAFCQHVRAMGRG
jgi:UDP-GlcNAc:polypeptide alpha-N-acetylglucosaminyltransferase